MNMATDTNKNMVATAAPNRSEASKFPSSEELLARSQKAWQLKDQWRAVQEDAYELVIPDFNPYYADKNQPRSKPRQYDSTAQNAAMRLANRLLIELTPPDQTWFDIKTGPLQELSLPQNELDQINEYLGKVVKILSLIFKSGSFVSAVWEHYLDLVVAGMGVMLALENPEDDTEPVNFQGVSQAEVAIEESAFGGVGGIFRKRKTKVRLIKDIWPDGQIPEELQQQLEKDRKDKDPEIEVIEVTCKVKGDKPWLYRVLWVNGDKPYQIVQRTYRSNPWIVSRWSKLPGTLYGPGPVIIALADIRTANKVMEMILKNAALALAGMYLVRDDGVVNPQNITITNGGFVPVASTGGTAGASIAPLETGRDFNVGQIVLDDLRMSIKKTLLDNALPPLGNGARSATEIIERMRELTQDIGGAVGRLTNEFIVPIVRRAHDIASNRGMVPPLKIDQFNMKIQVNSPLARSQQFQDVEKVAQWWQMAQSMGGQEATILAGKIEEIIPWMGDQVGVPDELIRSKAEREEMQKNVAQMIAAQQAQQNGANVGGPVQQQV